MLAWCLRGGGGRVGVIFSREVVSDAVLCCKVTTSFRGFIFLVTSCNPRYLVPDSSDVSMLCWPGALVGDFLLRPSQNFRAQDTGTLSCGRLRVGVPFCSFCFLRRLRFSLSCVMPRRPGRRGFFRSSALTLLSLGLCFCDCGHTFFLNAMPPLSGLTVGL